MQVDSPDSVSACDSAHVNINRFTIGDKAKERVLTFVLALSILVNAWALFAMRDMGTEQRLKQYNLDWFRTHEFADLKTEVEVQKRVNESLCRR